MRNWRTLAGALCIVVAMVLGAFAGVVYAREAGIVGASPSAGTRGEDRRLMSAFDESMKLMSSEEADQIAAAAPQTALALDSGAIETVSADGALTAKAVTPEDMKEAMKTVTVGMSDDGVITAHRETDVGTRSHFVGGEVDAGGPYGGPTTFEGGPAITFTATANDPTIIFYRWDLNADGVFDFPDQTGAGNLGRWTTSNVVTKVFNDDFFGQIVVQGWDGVSTTIQIVTGDNLGQTTAIQFIIGFGTFVFAQRFTAKVNMQVTALGHYHYVFALFQSGIWSVTPPALMSQCTPVHVNLQWNWCTLASPINLVAGQEYLIGYRTQSYGNLILASNTPASNQVTWGGLHYCFSTSLCYPSTFFSNFYQLMADFRFSQTIVRPDAASDSATLDINNVAPSVFGATTVPSPALEGRPADFTALFSDPGLDDTWEYRWIFHDGEVSPWRPVTKFNGGANVLLFHTYGPDGPTLRTNLMNACGNFCKRIDMLDFGPTGQNRVPALSEIRPYDVLVVGTNFFFGHSNGIGDLLANYMDVGGAVVIAQGGLDSTFGCSAGICGRWDTDKYSPIPRGPIFGAPGSMGAIYVPGHPLLDGVSTVGTSGLAGNIFTLNPGATRVVDWNNGRVLGATNTNPIVSNGARSVALNFFPILGFTSGDWARMTANAIRWASQQPDPTLKPMPIQLDPLAKIFKDDHPTTTTPVDSFPVRVEVRDDDHDKVRVTGSTVLFNSNFETTSQCSGSWPGASVWPSGWSAQPNTFTWTCQFFSTGGGRGPTIQYFYNDPLYGTGNGISNLRTPAYDLTGFLGIRMEYNHYWQGNYPFGSSDGLIQASLDGGATFPVMIAEYHWNNPATDRGDRVKENVAVGGFSNVVFRFRYQSNDDWWWFINSLKITAVQGSIIIGLGTADGVASVANVPPTAIGGFDSALRNEAQSLLFKGFEISDPAILEPTEWFAYAWDFDDGSAVDWRYVGSLAPPKFDILIVHTICLGLIGATCPDLNVLTSTLRAQDDVGTVDTFDYINYPALPTAPSLSLMLQYDVILVATNWAYFSFAPFDLARRQVGDRLAAYVDAGRGGAFTMMAVYDLSNGNDLFAIRGRYMDDDYGAFEQANYLFPGATGINILAPEHDLFVKVDGSKVGSMFIHSGNMPVTTGGKNAAAGRPGQLLARWAGDNNPSIGVKELNNGMRTAHFGAFGRPTGAVTGMLLRNIVGWVAGGIPSPKIAPFTHTYGDNGVYTVDFMAIDDDMGYVWDFAANAPLQVLPGISLSHRFVTVAVDNTDPVIQPNIEAFIASQVCVRVSGQGGNTVTANVFQDGVLSSSVSVTRESGSPNPDTEKCGLLRLDVLAQHTYSARLTYTAPNGGSNPTWLIFSPWREPINPGHGTVEYKLDFASAGTVDVALPTLKRDLLDNGQGAKIDFVAQAFDAGTDDLAFLWIWGTVDGTPYSVPNLATAVYTIHVHHNDGLARSDGVLAGPQNLGFGEPFFDRALNTGRTPEGSMGLTVRDSAVHGFDLQQTSYYVVLIVLDDDNTRGYPSPFGNDGIDMEFIWVNLG